MYAPRSRTPSAFSLIELLVVIAIIGVLIGLLLPAIQKAREAANRIICANNFKQLGIALHAYHDSNGVFPKGCSLTSQGSAWGSSWCRSLLPFLEHNEIASKWKDDKVLYQDGTNCALVHLFAPSVLFCPSSPLPRLQEFPYNDSGLGDHILCYTNYVGIAGSSGDRYALQGTAGIVSGGGILFPHSQISVTAITDGTSNTMVLGEQGDFMVNPQDGKKCDVRSSVPYSAWMGCQLAGSPPDAAWSGSATSFNRTYTCTTVRYTINDTTLKDPYLQDGFVPPCQNGECWDTGTNLPFTSTHLGGAQFLFCDGSVHFLLEDVLLSTLQALATRDDGQAVAIP